MPGLKRCTLHGFRTLLRRLQGTQARRKHGRPNLDNKRKCHRPCNRLAYCSHADNAFESNLSLASRRRTSTGRRVYQAVEYRRRDASSLQDTKQPHTQAQCKVGGTRRWQCVGPHPQGTAHGRYMALMVYRDHATCVQQALERGKET